jgi:hypothetical protein
MTDPQQPAAPAPPPPAPAPEGAVIPLPPVPRPAADTSPARGGYAADRLGNVLVLVLAFLTASFVARNSDLWFHLATGRLLAHGQYSFGADPFAYTTGDVYWANHAWLYDLGLYGLYELAGGSGLVLVKALLVTVLAGLLLGARRPVPVGTVQEAAAGWVPVVCVTLAILAMSPRLLLEPVTVSYVLLALTFWLLWRPHAVAEDGPDREGPRGSRLAPAGSSVLLLVVFALWVNLDQWFWLGPLLVALFWLGERLGGPRRTPGWLVPAGLAVCLLNPHAYHAFTLPDELSPVTWLGGLREDVRFRGVFASAWQPECLRAVTQGNVAVLAFGALVGLGLLSFAAHRPASRGWRLTVWLPFAVLAVCHVRAVPFFAVVGAPVAALNWQDFFATRAARRAPGRERRGWPLVRFALRGALSVSLLGLIFLTWAGKLVGRGQQERHVAWYVQAEPSLRRAAEVLHDWRQRGLLPAGTRVLALSPEVGQYCAWFCPGERHFFDHRFALFPAAAGEYETVCRALLPGLALDPASPAEGKGSEANQEPAADWRKVLRAHGVGVVVFYDRNLGRQMTGLARVANDGKNWTLMDVAGEAVLAGWKQAHARGAATAAAFDADRLAFGPQDDRACVRLPAPPEHGPDSLPARPGFWARRAHAPLPRAWESAAAATYVNYFNLSEAHQRRRQLREAQSTFAAGLAGLGTLPPAGPRVVLPLVLSRGLLSLPRNSPPRFLVRVQLGPFFSGVVDRPPALPLLAVRAARRAAAANPADARAWLALGQAYLLLRDQTCEHSAEGLLPPLAALRHVQIAAALEQALRLDPDLETAHHELASLYGARQYYDLSLEHVRAEIRLVRRAGPPPGETADDWDDRLEQLERDTGKLEELLEQGRRRYAAGFRSLQGDRVAEAGLALRLGLPGLALDDILLATPADVLGAPGMSLQLSLLLDLGRVEEVRPVLEDETLQAHKRGLAHLDLPGPQAPGGGAPYLFPYRWAAYDWLHALEAAAVGDYAAARRALGALRSGLRARRELVRRDLQSIDGLFRTVLPGLLSGPPWYMPAFSARQLLRLDARRALFRDGERTLRAQEADLDVLEGMLALERGDPEAARSAFARAQKLCTGSAGTPVPFGGAPIAASYLGKLTN